MIQAFIDRLTAQLPGVTVAQAPRGGDLVAIAARATGEQLVTLLDAVTPNAVVPITADDQATAPYSVFELVGGALLAIDGAALATVITYVVTLHAQTYPALADLIDSMVSVVAADAQAIEITDIAHVSKERPTASYAAALEVTITRPVITSADPVVLCWHLRSQAETEQDMDALHQRVTDQIGIAVLTTAGDLDAQRQAVQTALLGWQPTAEHFPTAYQAGERLSLGSGLDGWHDIYRSSIFINQA